MDFSQHFICGHECGLVRLLVLFFFFFSLALKRQIWLHMFPDRTKNLHNERRGYVKVDIHLSNRKKEDGFK